MFIHKKMDVFFVSENPEQNRICHPERTLSEVEGEVEGLTKLKKTSKINALFQSRAIIMQISLSQMRELQALIGLMTCFRDKRKTLCCCVLSHVANSA